MVGSAITIHSDAEKEYDECMLKAKAILSVLDNPQILN
jgi:para-aminobenzoate synthetase component 1